MNMDNKITVENNTDFMMRIISHFCVNNVSVIGYEIKHYYA